MPYRDCAHNYNVEEFPIQLRVFVEQRIPLDCHHFGSINSLVRDLRVDVGSVRHEERTRGTPTHLEVELLHHRRADVYADDTLAV